MRTLPRLLALGAAASLVLSACSAAATTAPTASPSASAAPSAAPSQAAASPSAAASINACAVAFLPTLTPGKLTIGTDNPAYPPYFLPPASGSAPKPWQLGDPTNGQGFESAVAYAVAERLGFQKDQVAWTVVPFENSFKPGPKSFDFYLAQVSYTAERATAVDMSDGYYFVAQSVVALKDNPIAKVTSVAGLKSFRFGAQVATTGYATITHVIAPTTAPSVYNTNDAAIAALKAKQIDGLVVDLPTAFYITAAQLDNSVIVGQFQSATGANAEHFSLVLTKGSPLTPCVNQALASMKADGTLDQITKEWMSDKASAPVFGP